MLYEIKEKLEKEMTNYIDKIIMASRSYNKKEVQRLTTELEGMIFLYKKIHEQIQKGKEADN